MSHAAQQQDPSNLQDQEVRAAATRDNAAPQEAPRARRLNRERARQVLGGTMTRAEQETLYRCTVRDFTAIDRG